MNIEKDKKEKNKWDCSYWKFLRACNSVLI
jgi:hypothetical protein